MRAGAELSSQNHASLCSFAFSFIPLRGLAHYESRDTNTCLWILPVVIIRRTKIGGVRHYLLDLQRWALP